MPAAFDKALQAVYEKEEAFIPPRLLVEMDAIAAGFCDGLRRKAPKAVAEKCDVGEAAAAVRRADAIAVDSRRESLLDAASINRASRGVADV